MDTKYLENEGLSRASVVTLFKGFFVKLEDSGLAVAIEPFSFAPPLKGDLLLV